jgi:hypothetical protein
MKKSFFISKVVLYLHHQTKQNASKQQANNLKNKAMRTLTNNDGTKKAIIYVIDLVTPVLVKIYKNGKYKGSYTYRNIDSACAQVNTWLAK